MSAAWSVKFPVYQIDFSAAAAGKRVASTKRRIRWRFGFPNKQALDEGRTGTDCRGEEHDIIITWSITSGKRQVAFDGREIHYSSSRAGLLDFSWTTKGNHVIKVVCHAAAPLSPTPGFRQYDLFIDGQSFFTMPKVYELGIKGPVPGHARVAGGFSNPTSPISMDSGYPRSVGGDYVPSSREQEEADLRRAIQASLEESRRHLESKGHGGGSVVQASQSTGEGDLLDFGSPAPSGPPGYSGNGSVSGLSYYSAPPTYSQNPPQYTSQPYQSPPPGQPPVNPGALVPSHGPPGGYYQGPPPTTPGYASPPPVPPAPAPTPQTGYAPHPHTGPQMNYMNAPSPQGHDTFGLMSTPGEDPFAPKPPPPPPQQDFASMILGAYQNGGQSSTPMAGGAQQNGGNPHTPQSNGSTPVQSMNAYAMVVHQDEGGPVSELEKAMKNLVNIDHIDEPAEGEYKLTMMKKEEAQKKLKGKSAPLPPVGKDIVGSNATLSQIKEVQHGQRTLKQTVDGVMNAPPPGAFSPNAAYAGALVVHGQGPPPLHQPMGFGLGARLPNGGFSHQQQAPPMGYQQQYH